MLQQRHPLLKLAYMQQALLHLSSSVCIRPLPLRVPDQYVLRHSKGAL